MNQSDYMLRAVSLAMKGKGRTYPNPCVGAVIVSGNRIIGEGYHRTFGAPHAEVEALDQARLVVSDLCGCVLYVTLEPCNHYGKTPPCTKAIIESGIKEVVVGTRDPNPSVSGGGVEFLRKNGVKVFIGVEEQQCQDLIADFRLWITSPRAYVYLKMASTLDGRIATRENHSWWVSSEASRFLVHELRSIVGAVIIGGNTFYQDNPRLTCRLADSDRQPISIVVTTRLPSPDQDFNLLQKEPGQTFFWTDYPTSVSPEARALHRAGFPVIALDRISTGLNLKQGLTILRQDQGIHYALCEGGGSLALSLVQSGLADEIWYFLAMKILGDHKAVPVFHGRKALVMSQALNFRLAESLAVDTDMLLRLFPGPRTSTEHLHKE
ncbi:MAG: bifunctional diaminohydroxyphosphoribosylaminopyrimidine deaminase/5-amino-6-(5-phosphoribosylamino)uracil reductase RibD [Desulfonatronovibrionaceae bacterium]